MTDIVDSATRSRMMSGIRGKNTKPEVLVRSLLHRRGFRFRLHVKDLPGRPDIVLPKYKAVIFVNGCFWHGHDCHLFRLPSSRTEFWRRKIEKNCENDLEAKDELVLSGWRVAFVWECSLRGRLQLEHCHVADLLSAWLKDASVPVFEVRGRTTVSA